MELEEDWNYGYSSPDKAMCEFPGGTKRKPKASESGPCIGFESGHSNVVDSNGKRLGSIVCCACCEGPVLEMRCGTR
jgi:hypothetical protein